MGGRVGSGRVGHESVSQWTEPTNYCNTLLGPWHVRGHAHGCHLHAAFAFRTVPTRKASLASAPHLLRRRGAEVVLGFLLLFVRWLVGRLLCRRLVGSLVRWFWSVV